MFYPAKQIVYTCTHRPDKTKPDDLPGFIFTQISLALPDGRVVPVSAGQFSVGSAAVSVTVSRVTTTDITPPSRITDLTVTSVHDTTVNLTWAAPGGDLDQGSGESSARKCGCLISMQVLLEK